MSFLAKTKSDKIAVTVIKIQWRQASRRKIARFRALRLTHGVRRRASLTIFNVLAAFTSDYRPQNPSSTQRISAKQAEISRWRLTRGGHKGNRAIIVNRLNLPPFPLNLPRTKRKRKERERELDVNYPGTDSDRTHFSIILSSLGRRYIAMESV